MDIISANFLDYDGWNDDMRGDDNDYMFCDESEAYQAIQKKQEQGYDADAAIFDCCVRNNLVLLTSDMKLRKKICGFNRNSVVSSCKTTVVEVNVDGNVRVFC